MEVADALHVSGRATQEASGEDGRAVVPALPFPDLERARLEVDVLESVEERLGDAQT